MARKRPGFGPTEKNHQSAHPFETKHTAKGKEMDEGEPKGNECCQCPTFIGTSWAG